LEVPKLAGQINQCRGTVETARSRQPDFESWWREARAKQKRGEGHKAIGWVKKLVFFLTASTAVRVFKRI
jgi:hypothetical protein